MTNQASQGQCSHQRNPIDTRARMTAAENIATRYPSIARDLPDVAGAMAAYDAYVAEYGYQATEAPGIAS